MAIKIPWDIADLISQQLSGSLSREQETILQQWLDSSERHQALYDRICSGKNFVRFRQQIEEYRYENKYKAFRSYVRAKKANMWKRMGYAAAILLPLSLAIGLYLSQPRSEGMVPTQTIHPGEFRATLMLGNGRIIPLSPQVGINRIEQTNAVIQGNTLSYDQLQSQDHLEYHKITIPRGGEYIVDLADGTRVWLNSESELSYPVVFATGQRKVNLTGEAYFEVAHDSLHPFVVETAGQQLTVLGTSFGIRAYTGEKSILTTLETGRVNIRTDHQEVILNPGQQSSCIDDVLTVREVDVEVYTSWHKGIFIFRHQRLGEILNTLARWYNISVFYTAPELQDIYFTGELKRYDQLQDFLNKLEVLEKVRFTIKGETVTVSSY